MALSSSDFPVALVQQLDSVFLHPTVDTEEQVLTHTRHSIARVLEEFLTTKKIAADRITVTDGFLFIFNEPKFARWHALDWWEQRHHIMAIRNNAVYAARARDLLAGSSLGRYMDYDNDAVAKSNDLDVKHAWMRKRLAVKECYWNAIDSFSHAAYFKKKYRQLLPALCVLLCTITDSNGRETELFLGIDNGTGFQYKKKSRESALIRFLYIVYKFMFRNGVFYIGGLELGLLETDGVLSCHGSGAVVYQGWCRGLLSG